ACQAEVIQVALGAGSHSSDVRCDRSQVVGVCPRYDTALIVLLNLDLMPQPSRLGRVRSGFRFVNQPPRSGAIRLMAPPRLIEGGSWHEKSVVNLCQGLEGSSKVHSDWSLQESPRRSVVGVGGDYLYGHVHSCFLRLLGKQRGR